MAKALSSMAKIMARKSAAMWPSPLASQSMAIMHGGAAKCAGAGLAAAMAGSKINGRGVISGGNAAA